MTEIDFRILDLIREKLSNGFLDTVMPWLTAVGNVGIIWIIIAAAMLISRKYRRNGLELAAGLVGCALVGNLLLKNLIARQRPCWINDTIELLIAVPLDYSFPSGHTMASFAAAAIILHANRKFGIAAYILAVLIAFSRLYLYVHFPTDVLAGAIIGTLIGIAVCFFPKKFFPPKGASAENNTKHQ